MPKVHIEPEKLLKEVKAVLLRTKKHKVWKLPNGAIVVLSGTPSCPFAKKKQVKDIQRLMGV